MKFSLSESRKKENVSIVSQDDRTITDIWQKYEKGVEYLHKIGHITKTDKCHRFYIGDQWYGIKSGGEELPSLNFIKGIIKYKVATVAQNSMTAVYSSLNDSNVTDEKTIKACEILGKYFERQWERGKLDKLSWKLIKEAAIQGDSYIYFGEGADVTGGQIVDNVNIFLADEQNENLQEQKYIIIRERRFVSDIIEEAKRNGIDDNDLDLIIADTDNKDQLGDKIEVRGSDKDGKCVSLLYMEKDKEGFVHIARSVKNLVYQPDTILKCEKQGEKISKGLKSYPIINFIWEDKKGSARGSGDVEYLIPNQIEVNKTIARRSISVKNNAYPMLAYAENLISNPDELDVVGGRIGINNGNAQAINQVISYLTPAQISPDAKNLSDELINLSRDLSGAGDSATGNIDPTQASGTAIIAVRDQAALPLNEQLSRYSQFVEDLAYLWFDMWVAYNTDGITVEIESEGRKAVQTIPADQLEDMKVNVKVDVSKTNPFSIYAIEQNLINFMQSQFITFEEMVRALPSGSAVPKGKLQEIIDKRAVEQQKEIQVQSTIQGLQQQNSAMAGQLQQATEALKNLMGSNEMPQEQGMQL